MGIPQEPARIFEIGWNEYRAIRRMNPSTICKGFESMKALLAVLEGNFYEETNSMRLGTGIHALALEPEEFEDRYVVVPDFHKDPGNKTSDGTRSDSKATRYYKDTVSDFLNANRGKIAMDSSEYRKVLKATQAIAGHKEAAPLVKNAAKEQTVFGDICGVPFKGRIDLLDLEFKGCISDVKTTQSCNKYKFSHACRTYFYPQKLSIYRELVRQAHGITLDVKIIAQETSGAFDTAVFELDSDELDTVFSEVVKLIERYKQAQVEDYWPGSDGGLGAQKLDKSAYGYAKKTEDEFVDWEELNDE